MPPPIPAEQYPELSLRRSTQNFVAMWGELEKDFQNIFSSKAMNRPPGKVFHAAHSLTCNDMVNVPGQPSDKCGPVPHVFYQHLNQFLINQIESRAVKTLPRLRGEQLLTEYLKEWSVFETAASTLNSLCHSLNKNVEKKEQFTEIRTLALMLWRDRLLQNIRENLVQAVLTSIEADRNGTAHNPAIKGVLASFVAVGMDNKRPTHFYTTWFENVFLQMTDQYYTREGERKLQIMSGEGVGEPVAAFLQHVEGRIADEQRRSQMYLDRSSEKAVVKCLVKVLVEAKVDVILSRFNEWLNANKMDDLKRMFRLLSRSENCLDPLRKLIEDRIDADGRDEMQKADTKDPMNFVLSYVDIISTVHYKFEQIVNTVFDKHPLFVQALEKGCKKFINNNVHTAKDGTKKSAEFVAKYMHYTMKTNTGSVNDTERQILTGIKIFSFLEDKDVFLSIYSTFLSKRLIFRTSVSSECEEQAISKLKEICGHERTYRLQRMFTDCNMSKEMNEKFRAWASTKPESAEVNLETFHVEVLTSGSWPAIGNSTAVTLPKEIAVAHIMFENHYKEERTGRKLTWTTVYSNGVLKTNYTRKPYDLHVLSSHLVVLYNVFNTCGLEGDQMPWVKQQMILAKCPMDEKELNFTLGALVKLKLLLLGEGANAQCFALNPAVAFKDKKVLVHQLVGTRSDVEPQPDETHQGMRMVEEDRKYAIQAAIVRVLKNRKLIGHQALVSEVIDQLKNSFQPTVADIKRNIDTLIEKEYMERRTEDGGYYEYIA